MPTKIHHVLVLCTGNSARRVMAEALLNVLGAGQFKAFSAGSFPSGTVPPIDIVIAVCDNAAGEVCLVWPGCPVNAHWGVPDPAAVEGANDVRRRAFESVWTMLRQHIDLLLTSPLDSFFS